MGNSNTIISNCLDSTIVKCIIMKTIHFFYFLWLPGLLEVMKSSTAPIKSKDFPKASHNKIFSDKYKSFRKITVKQQKKLL